MAKANKRLRRERELRGWSQEYVANQIGASDSSYVSRWERGVVKPTPYYRERLCRLFEKSAEELGFLDQVDEPHASQETLSEPLHRETNPPNDIPQPKKSAKKLLSWLVGIAVVLVVASVLVISLRLLFVVPKQSKPGGIWISPSNGEVIHSRTIHFSAYAYPTNPDDPAIDHVNFTIVWQGINPRKWIIACAPKIHDAQDRFQCDYTLPAHTPPGLLKISFDVYDKMGIVNFAPNGIHMLTYAPLLNTL